MKEMMISVSERYFKALSDLDREAYLSCFSENAELLDPYGGRHFDGREGLEKWFNGMERTWSKFSMIPTDFFPSGDRVAVPWVAEATAKSDKTAKFSGINVFTVDESGLIVRLEGYWDASAMMSQIS